MTWEGQLRALEEQYAAGALSPEEYRLGRDRLLMQSQGAGPATPETNQQPSETNTSNPGPGPNPGPQPPSGVESTQVMRAVGHGEPRAPGADADQTQVVRDTNRRAPSGDGGSSPWSDSDSAPVVVPDSIWLSQGRDAFSVKKTPKRRIVGVIVVVVLVIGLAVAGGVYFTHRGATPVPDTTTNHTTSAKPTSEALPTPPPTKAAPVDTRHALIKPPGAKRNGGGPFTLKDLKSDGLLPKAVVAALRDAGMTDGLLKTTVGHGVTIGMYALTVADSKGAQHVATVYGTIQMEGGLPSNSDLSMVGVPVYSTNKGAKNNVFRAVYVLYKRVIIVEAFGPDRHSAKQTFAQVMQQQVNHAPPTVRGS